MKERLQNVNDKFYDLMATHQSFRSYNDLTSEYSIVSSILAHGKDTIKTFPNAFIEQKKHLHVLFVVKLALDIPPKFFWTKSRVQLFDNRVGNAFGYAVIFFLLPFFVAGVVFMVGKW